MITPHIDVLGFASWLRSWGAAETTVAARLTFLAAITRDLDPVRATADELARWLGNPAFKQWTRVTYFSHLRSLYDWLRRTGARADDPTELMRRPKDPPRKPRPLTEEEVVAIAQRATGDELTWLNLGMLAGLRAFEIAKFRGEDITETTIFVRGKGGVESFLPTHPILWSTAQSYPRRGFWFPSERAASGHVHDKSLTTRMTRLFTSAGVVGSTHRARHTYGTRLLRGGANIRVVQELMRHASLATTAGYLLVEDDEKAAAIRALPPVA